MLYFTTRLERCSSSDYRFPSGNTTTYSYFCTRQITDSEKVTATTYSHFCTRKAIKLSARPTFGAQPAAMALKVLSVLALLAGTHFVALLVRILTQNIFGLPAASSKIPCAILNVYYSLARF